MMGQPGGPMGVSREAGARLLFNLRTFELLKIRNFRFYLISSIAQMTPMNMQMTASGWFMYKLTGSVALLGVTMLVSAVPQLALSFVGGVIADRVSRKTILIAGQLATIGCGHQCGIPGADSPVLLRLLAANPPYGLRAWMRHHVDIRYRYTISSSA